MGPVQGVIPLKSRAILRLFVGIRKFCRQNLASFFRFAAELHQIGFDKTV